MDGFLWAAIYVDLNNRIVGPCARDGGNARLVSITVGQVEPVSWSR